MLLYDVFTLLSSSIRGLHSVKDYADAVAAVIHSEAQLAKSSSGENGVEEASSQPKREFSAERQSINLIWEYVHSVLLPFLLEELSQFPFWAAKVALLTDDAVLDSIKDAPLSGIFSPVSLSSRFFGHIAAKYTQHGLLSLFEGSMPYLYVAFFSNIRHIEEASRTFLVNLVASLPRSLSSRSNVNGGKHQSGGRKLGTGSTAKLHRKLDRKAQESLAGAVNQSGPTKPAGAMKTAMCAVASATLTHPMLLLALSMVKKEDLRGQSALYAYFLLIARHGIRRGLFTGLRAALTFAVLNSTTAPLSPAVFCGVPEIISYRCILRRTDEADSAAGAAADGADGDKTGGMLSVGKHLLSRHGVFSVFSYGYLTLLQMGPGFVCFLSGSFPPSLSVSLILCLSFFLYLISLSHLTLSPLSSTCGAVDGVGQQQDARTAAAAPQGNHHRLPAGAEEGAAGAGAGAGASSRCKVVEEGGRDGGSFLQCNHYFILCCEITVYYEEFDFLMRLGEESMGFHLGDNGPSVGKKTSGEWGTVREDVSASGVLLSGTPCAYRSRIKDTLSDT